MTAPGDPQLVLQEVRELALRRAWPRTVEFLDSLPEHGDRSILVLPAAGVDEPRFLDLVKRANPRTPVRVEFLESVAANSSLAASHNRVAVLLRCGALLTPEVIEAAQRILQRPASSYIIVLTGASVITSPEDYDIVARGIWRLLVGDPRVDWAGQDLAALRCHLWSAEPANDYIVTEIRQGASAIAEWLADSDMPDGPLAAVQAAHALALAENEFAAQLPPAVSTQELARRIERLNSAARTVADVRTRLTRRLDADEASIERTIAASLQLLEQDLLKDVGPYLDKNKAQLSSIPGRKEVLVGYLNESLQRWREETIGSLSAHLRRMSTETSDLLERIDWHELQKVEPDGRVPREADNFLSHFADKVTWDYSDVASDFKIPTTQNGRPAWTQHLIIAVSGGVLAAATAVVLSPAVVAAAAGGALGAAGGGLISKHVAGASSARDASEYARRVIPTAVGAVLLDIRKQIRTTFAPIREDVKQGLEEVEAVFTSAVERLRPDDSAATRVMEDNADYARLSTLHEALGQAH
jgi:hypothetical protein